jgi:hypothetical protein
VVLVLNTLSAIVSFAKKLEEDSARLYEELADKHSDGMLISFANENRDNKTIVERAYYGVISDQVESSFFEELDGDEYRIDGEKVLDLRGILEVEETIQRFYLDAASRLVSFLPDVSNAFKRIVKRREKRLEKLEMMENG